MVWMLPPLPITRFLVMALALALLSGCLSTKLLKLDVQQRKQQISELDQSIAFLSPQPALGPDYEGHLFISGEALNSFLAGFQDYKIPLPKPKKTYVLIKGASLEFQDGSTDAVINATAYRDGWPVEIRLRILAKLIVTPEPSTRELKLAFHIEKVLPDIKLSIFRLREFYVAQYLMRLKGQELLDAAPTIAFSLKPDIDLQIASSSESIAKTNHGKGSIKIRVSNPGAKARYEYTVYRAQALADGMHLYFRLGSAIQ